MLVVTVTRVRFARQDSKIIFKIQEILLFYPVSNFQGQKPKNKLGYQKQASIPESAQKLSILIIRISSMCVLTARLTTERAKDAGQLLQPVLAKFTLLH